jgi:hypothetical protein
MLPHTPGGSADPKTALPPFPVKDGTNASYRAKMLIQLVESRAPYLNPSQQAMIQWLMCTVAPEWQHQVCDIEAQCLQPAALTTNMGACEGVTRTHLFLACYMSSRSGCVCDSMGKPHLPLNAAHGVCPWN